MVGALCVGGSALMAYLGVRLDALQQSLPVFILYWTGFVALLGVALYTVLLDIRYIRLQYAVAKRQIFLETLGEKEFREALLKAREAEEKSEG